MMLLIFVQNVVVFAVTVSMISTIVSRYNTYREISDLVSGNGSYGLDQEAVWNCHQG